MRVIKAYKDLSRIDENRRIYVVPETGREANDFSSYEHIIRGRTERWPCIFITSHDRQKGKAVVFRYREDQPEEIVVEDVQRGLEKGDKQFPREAMHSEKAQIRFQRPYNEDQWNIYTKRSQHSLDFMLGRIFSIFGER